MIVREGKDVVVSPKNKLWKARLENDKVDALKEIALGDDVLVQEVSCYLDSLKGEHLNCSHPRDYRKQGVEVIKTSGENNDKTIELKQTYRFHHNCVRITTDLNIRTGFKLKRRIGIGSLFLPGEWSRMTVMPPVEHLTQGDEKYTVKLGSLPENSMVGHWHHPPLYLIFERKNGKRLEVGTGSDLWRWNSSLQERPQTASYKVFKCQETDSEGNVVKGLCITREPLMTCIPYTPKARQYRFSWYISWDYGFKKAQLPNHTPILLNFDEHNKYNRQSIIDQLSSNIINLVYLDLSKLNWHPSFYAVASPFDLLEDKKSDNYCLEANKVYGIIKDLMRKIKTIDKVDGIVFSNLRPYHCSVSSHMNGKEPLGRSHWSINSLLELAAWLRHNSSKNFICYQVHSEKDLSPSMTGLLNDYF